MATGEESAPALAPALTPSPPTLPGEAIKAEVRDLLELKLMGNDAAVKIETLHKLADYFAEKGEGQDAYQRKEEHRRAVERWDGCHFALSALRLELDKADGPHRDIVYGVIRFFTNWSIGSSERCDVLSRFYGIGVIAEGARAFLDDGEIATAAICCFFNFTSDSDAKRVNELVEGDAIQYVIHAMTAHVNAQSLQKRALIILERSYDVSGHRQRDRLVEKGALYAVSAAYTTHLLSSEQIRSLCSNLMNKLCVP